MYKGAAVIGDKDSIYIFASIGLSIFPVTDKTDGLKRFRQLCSGDYAVIYITESLAVEMEEEIEKVSGRICPAVILIPGVCGNTGKGKERVRKSVEKAVGSDILFSNK